MLFDRGFLILQWQSVKRLGAKVVLVGDSYDEAQAHAKRLAKDEGRTFIPPFDHPDVIMGQGTVGMEIIRQVQEPLHAIFVPVGGGGLIAGIAAYVKRVSPQVCWLLYKIFCISLSLSDNFVGKLVSYLRISFFIMLEHDEDRSKHMQFFTILFIYFI